MSNYQFNLLVAQMWLISSFFGTSRGARLFLGIFWTLLSLLYMLVEIFS